jgi:hypothetical protein
MTDKEIPPAERRLTTDELLRWGLDEAIRREHEAKGRRAEEPAWPFLKTYAPRLLEPHEILEQILDDERRGST